MAAAIGAASLSAASQPAHAGAPATAAEAADRLQAFGQWAKQIADAVAPSNAAAVVFVAKVKQLLANPTPEQRGENARTIRAAAAEMRQTLGRSEAALAQVQPFRGSLSGMAPEDAGRILTEARSQVSGLRHYVEDVEVLAAAVERGDAAAARTAGLKVIRSGFALLRSQVVIFRGRQALFPPDRSGHQIASVSICLYEAMGAAAENWFAARLDNRPEQAASEQRARFLALAETLEAEVRRGRANAAREFGEIARARKTLKDARSIALADTLGRVAPLVEAAFSVGDEIVSLLRARAGTSGAELAAQPYSQTVADLSALEQRFIATTSQATALMARMGG